MNGGKQSKRTQLRCV